MSSTSREWLDMLQVLFFRGESASPRGLPCRELLGYVSTIPMWAPCLLVPERKLSRQFMAAEAAWILSGDNRLATIKRYAPSIAQFSDDGVTFFGAYGPKVMSQLDYVVQTLVRDPSSRQAVLTIWRENPPLTKDCPCTVSVQWLVRPNPITNVLTLYCIDSMRSSDAWLGWVYDVFNFSMISAVISLRLRRLGLEVALGKLMLVAGSQHLYEKNQVGAMRCLAGSIDFDPKSELNLKEFDVEKELVAHLWDVADGIVSPFSFLRA